MGRNLKANKPKAKFNNQFARTSSSDAGRTGQNPEIDSDQFDKWHAPEISCLLKKQNVYKQILKIEISHCNFISCVRRLLVVECIIRPSIVTHLRASLAKSLSARTQPYKNRHRGCSLVSSF